MKNTFSLLLIPALIISSLSSMLYADEKPSKSSIEIKMEKAFENGILPTKDLVLGSFWSCTTSVSSPEQITFRPGEADQIDMIFQLSGDYVGVPMTFEKTMLKGNQVRPATDFHRFLEVREISSKTKFRHIMVHDFGSTMVGSYTWSFYLLCIPPAEIANLGLDSTK